MGHRSANSTKATLGLMAFSIAANILVFAYIFAGKAPDYIIYGVLSGIAGAVLYRLLDGHAVRRHSRSEPGARPASNSRGFFPAQVSSRQSHHRPA